VEKNIFQVTFLFQDAEPISSRVLRTRKRKSPKEDNNVGAGTRSKRRCNNSRHEEIDDSPVLVEPGPTIDSVSDESCAQNMFRKVTVSSNLFLYFTVVLIIFFLIDSIKSFQKLSKKNVPHVRHDISLRRWVILLT
jgi:hypothetical protein